MELFYVLLALMLSLIAGYVFYQIFLHPLGKYPGPLLAKVTRARMGYHQWKGDTHIDIWLCHKKYGPIVRYGPDCVIFNTATALQDIYITGKNIQKPQILEAMSHKTRDILTIIDPAEHAIRRRLVSRSLTGASFNAMESRLVSYIEIFCNQIHSGDLEKATGWTRAMNMEPLCTYLAFDIMSQFVFGLNYDLLRQSQHRHIIGDIEVSRVRTAVLVNWPTLYVGRLDKILFRESVAARKRFLKFVDQLISDVSEIQGVTDGSMFSNLSTWRDDQSGKKLTPVEVRAEAVFLIIAGYDTTATALAGTLFYLSRNPDAYSKLAREIRCSFKQVDDIRSGGQLNKCEYLRACIKESLRMSPPVPSCPWREVSSSGTEIDGQFLPAGILVATSIYGIQHHPGYFPRPHEYIPGRWLDNESMDLSPSCLSSFNAFSRGSRSCVAMGFAYWELSIAIARIMFLYDFRVPAAPEGEVGAGDPAGSRGRTNPGEYQMYDRMTSGKQGPWLQFRRR
ncbi:cytochrome P450 [Aspergillus sergii]|uniref:Cytochrome P450 n=1 Tax=Aspergillus sergii TaxID=1034303 RepID=A0A5N6WWU1_9EURO|nr:cytochrome P450 [Aspergillus sergii]